MMAESTNSPSHTRSGRAFGMMRRHDHDDEFANFSFNPPRPRGRFRSFSRSASKYQSVASLSSSKECLASGSNTNLASFGRLAMVLFININVNQRVELDVYGNILTGKVKYKGPLNGVPGDWVGVALDKALGRHDGMLNGRRYFSCRPNCGVFITADKIRFIPIRRNKYDSYRPVSDRSEVDEALFTSYSTMMIEDEPSPLKSTGWVSENYLERASNIFPNAGRSLDDSRNYHLPHSVSNTMSACTMLRPTTSKARFFDSDEPCCSRYYRDWEEADLSQSFISSPSIPKTHMPHPPLKRQVERGWDYDHYVREMSVNTGRDWMKYSQWNDISG